ncbi:MAG: redoxin domain-containing protein [Saprospiraceae bacterium]|nr:redoxin domain-containing protein [Saprospiraceae bacterium]MDW8230912.1 redoxin domain-containing protein [Saprospiraceae bacterium]
MMQRIVIAILLSVFCAWASFSLAQSAPAVKDSTHIEAFIEGLPAGTARLVGTYGDQNYIADTAVVDATGHFVLRRERALPAGFYYFLLPGQKNFSILVDRDDQRMTLRAKADDIPGTLQITGSLNTILFYRNARYQNAQEPELKQLSQVLRDFPPNSPEYERAKTRQNELIAQRKAHLDSIYREYPNAFFTKFKIAGQNPDWPEFRKPNGDLDTLRNLIYYRDHFWDNVDFNDTRLLHTPVIANKLKRYIVELTPQQPDSIIKVADPLVQRVLPYKEYFQFFVNWIALNYENGKTKVMDGEAVMVFLIDKYFTPELATWDTPENIAKIRKKADEMKASLLGRKGPDVRALDVNGEYKSIYEMTAPLIVVFMYSPDCDHCREQAPEIQRIYQRWKNRGVDFYGIALNTTDEKWKEFVRKNGFTFTNVFDPTNRAIYAKYFVDITPELYVLNKDRIIVAKNLQASQLETIFERELAKMGR